MSFSPRRVLVLALLTSLHVGCSHLRAAPPPPPDPDALRSATYVGVIESPVTLADGRFEGEPLAPDAAARLWVELSDELASTGDVTGDGQEEAIVLLSTGSGGSGVFSYVAVMGQGDEGVVNLGTELIGDRVQIRGMRVETGVIEIDVVQAGANDPACCPTELATRSFAMSGTQLIERPARVTGELALDVLSGTEWTLTRLARNEPAPDEPPISLKFSGTQLTGDSGCNRYSGRATPGAAGQMTIGPIAGTRMACPEPAMALERRYLQALQQATRFGFLDGGLLLSWISQGQVGTLHFERRQEPTTP